MKLKDIPVAEWTLFKRRCPNVRTYLTHSLAGRHKAELDCNTARAALKMLMKAIPEDVLPKIPEEVKLACLINLPEYAEMKEK